MSDTVWVDSDLLRANANDMRTFMQQLRSASGNAADPWDPNSYGIVGEGVCAALLAWAVSANSCVSAVIDAGEFVADQVEAMAAEYDLNEETQRANFKIISSSLDPGVAP